MAKKDIGKILTTGSPKQRAILWWENIARGKYFQEKLLTDSDRIQLSNSFKKPNEIKLWNEFRELDDTVTNAIVNLQGKLFEVKMNYSNLRGYILVWNSIENTELLVNSVLHEIKDPKERKRIAEDGAKGIDLLFSKTEPDQEGYIEIKVDFEKDSYEDKNGERIDLKDKPRKTKEYSLWYVMNNVKKEVETSVIKYLSWERAILDFMDERGFNIKTYKDQIKNMTTQVYSPIIGWAKYSGELNTGLSHPRLEEIIKKYAICPNIGEIKVDEAQYNWFRRYFLDVEDYPDELRGKVNKNLSYE
jgi:hypothetical protein